jgi:hypothetical protein
MRLKLVPSSWGYSLVTLSPAVTFTETWCSSLGLTTPPSKNPVVRKSKEGYDL